MELASTRHKKGEREAKKRGESATRGKGENMGQGVLSGRCQTSWMSLVKPLILVDKIRLGAEYSLPVPACPFLALFGGHLTNILMLSRLGKACKGMGDMA